MTSVLYVDQLEQELIDIRKKNRQLVREIRNMQEENFLLCQQMHEDRKWFSEVTGCIREALDRSANMTLVKCRCGLEAALQRAHEKALHVERAICE